MKKIDRQNRKNLRGWRTPYSFPNSRPRSASKRMQRGQRRVKQTSEEKPWWKKGISSAQSTGSTGNRQPEIANPQGKPDLSKTSKHHAPKATQANDRQAINQRAKQSSASKNSPSEHASLNIQTSHLPDKQKEKKQEKGKQVKGLSYPENLPSKKNRDRKRSTYRQKTSVTPGSHFIKKLEDKTHPQTAQLWVSKHSQYNLKQIIQGNKNIIINNARDVSIQVNSSRGYTFIPVNISSKANSQINYRETSDRIPPSSSTNNSKHTRRSQSSLEALTHEERNRQRAFNDFLLKVHQEEKNLLKGQNNLALKIDAKEKNISNIPKYHEKIRKPDRQTPSKKESDKFIEGVNQLLQYIKKFDFKEPVRIRYEKNQPFLDFCCSGKHIITCDLYSLLESIFIYQTQHQNR